MKEIFLLRHGDTGQGEKYIGSTDVALSTAGMEEISRLRTFLQSIHFDRVICSPLLRCRQTCDQLELQQDVVIDRSIREIDFGRWEGKNFQEIQTSDPQLVEKWARAEPAFAFPEGESMTGFRKRVVDFSSSVQSLKDNRLLIITHGGVIRHLICTFLKLSFDNYLYFDIRSGRVTTINLHSLGGVLTGLNIGAFNG